MLEEAVLIHFLYWLAFQVRDHFAGTKAKERNKKATPALMLIRGHPGREMDA